MLRLAENSLMHGGPPCSSYVWVSRGSTGRSKGDPDGSDAYESVKLANKFLGVCMLLHLVHVVFSSVHSHG